MSDGVNLKNKYCLCGCEEEVKNKFVKGHRNKIYKYERTQEHKKLMSERRSNIPVPEERKNRISQTLIKKYSDGEIIHPLKNKKMKDIVYNYINPMIGKKRLDLSERNKNNLMIGVKNPSWLGGKSYEPYSYEFNKKLKQQIKERDNYKCQLCSKIKENNGVKKQELAIHHIDYNKNNCAKENLITLCHSDNAKVNKDRNVWTLYFQNWLENKYEYKILE